MCVCALLVVYRARPVPRVMSCHVMSCYVVGVWAWRAKVLPTTTCMSSMCRETCAWSAELGSVSSANKSYTPVPAEICAITTLSMAKLSSWGPWFKLENIRTVTFPSTASASHFTPTEAAIPPWPSPHSCEPKLPQKSWLQHSLPFTLTYPVSSSLQCRQAAPCIQHKRHPHPTSPKPAQRLCTANPLPHTTRVTCPHEPRIDLDEV